MAIRFGIWMVAPMRLVSDLDGGSFEVPDMVSVPALDQILMNSDNLPRLTEAVEEFRQFIRLMEAASKAWIEISYAAEVEADRLHSEVQKAMKEVQGAS